MLKITLALTSFLSLAAAPVLAQDAGNLPPEACEWLADFEDRVVQADPQLIVAAFGEQDGNSGENEEALSELGFNEQSLAPLKGMSEDNGQTFLFFMSGIAHYHHRDVLGGYDDSDVIAAGIFEEIFGAYEEACNG